MTSEFGQVFTYAGRQFLRAEVPEGDNRGRVFTVAHSLAGRYQVLGYFASGGMGLLLQGVDVRTETRVLIKAILHYDVIPYARVRDREGFTNQLRVPRKTLEMERRILVLLRNAGCNAVPHPNDFVFDANPHLAGPYATEDQTALTYDDADMIGAEPYLIMEMIRGRSLADVLAGAVEHRISEARALRIMLQATEVLRILHEPVPMRSGMTWQLIYQDLKPANLILSEQDRVTVLDLGGCQLLNVETGQKLLSGACTSGYCPPECEQPYAVLTPAADVYTVGSNLFHMLTGRNPLDMVPAALAQSTPRATRLDTKLLEGKCRLPLRHHVERCLDPEPAKRFTDIPSLQKALRTALAEA